MKDEVSNLEYYMQLRLWYYIFLTFGSCYEIIKYLGR